MLKWTNINYKAHKEKQFEKTYFFEIENKK